MRRNHPRVSAAEHVCFEECNDVPVSLPLRPGEYHNYSIVIESMRFKNQVCGIEGGTEGVTCNRNTYGLVTGFVGLVVSFLISLFSTLGRDSALITTIAGFVMAVLYTLCAGLLTFDNGPATYVGNHYFSAWAGFFISFAVFGSVLKEFLGVGGGGVPQSSAPAEGEPDVEMDRI